MSGALLPLVLVVLLGTSFERAVPGRGDFAINSKGPDFFNSISSDARQIALATLGATALLFREGRWGNRPFFYWAVGTLGVLSAMGSVFSSFIFRLGLAQQLSANIYNPDLLAGRLISQGILLILSLCALVALTLMTFVPATSQTATEPGN